jgi:hypothetical protein
MAEITNDVIYDNGGAARSIGDMLLDLAVGSKVDSISSSIM